MTRDVELRMAPAVAANDLKILENVSTKLGIDINRIKKIEVVRRSIDARQRAVVVNLTIRVHIDKIEIPELTVVKDSYKNVTQNSPVAIIVGAGPAGLFAALKCLEEGIRPIILERGKDVDSRRKDLASISREGKVDPDSNYCFGEGGAGAFSDGKLYTRSKKRGSVEKILRVLNEHGAPDSILVDAHPHIGTDLLPGIIRDIRKTIEEHGGEVHFNEKVVDLLIDNNSVKGVVTSKGETYLGPIILATGHSARDTIRMLADKGVRMEPKGIAMGVRLEHPQEMIDRLQYHSKEGRGKYLPAAEYSFLTRIDDRAVYSFCMCPGGVIVPSASASEQSVVNGMSPSNRGTKWANSGMVVEILPEDVPGGNQLKMMYLQERAEKRFYEAAGGTQKAPAQRMSDFVNGVPSKSLEPSSYAPGLIPARVDKLLDPMVSHRLQKGFVEFNRKKKGFLSPKATVIGVETRTSSPVRIPRQSDTLQHVDIKNLYPVGEGAGWAGGIVSAAIDGENAANALAEALKNRRKEQNPTKG